MEWIELKDTDLEHIRLLILKLLHRDWKKTQNYKESKGWFYKTQIYSHICSTFAVDWAKMSGFVHFYDRFSFVQLFEQYRAIVRKVVREMDKFEDSELTDIQDYSINARDRQILVRLLYSRAML